MLCLPVCVCLPDMSGVICKYHNCQILSKGKIIREDLWVRNGIIEDPRHLFYTEKRSADTLIDCQGLLICPGMIDIQLNGGFGVDFSSDSVTLVEGVDKVSVHG